MAVGISELLTLSVHNSGKTLADNISQGNAALMKMEEKGNIRTFDGGTSIREPLDYGTNTNVAWISGSETFGVGATEHASAADFAIKQLVGTVSVNGLEKIQNSGKGKIVDLVSSKVKNLERNMRNKVATDMHGDGTGSSSKTITGFLLMCPTTTTTGTYGGITRSTAGNEFWQSQIKTNTAAAATIQVDMNALYVDCSRGTDHTDLILSGATAYKFFLASLQAQQQQMNPKMAEAGFTSVRYIGADVVLDNNTSALTATHMLFLNTNYIHWRPFEGLNFAPITPEKRAPTNQDVSISVMGWAGNLTCSGARFQGRYNGA